MGEIALASIKMLIFPTFVVLALITNTASKLVTKIQEGKLLNQYAFIQTHDSVTGELDERRDFVVADWTRTQNGTIVQQLDCGARALDYRPYLSEDGNLYGHHGPIVIRKLFKETLREIKLWTKENPTELVIISLSHCVNARFNNNYYADDCFEKMMAILKDSNIPTISDGQCDQLNSLTMEKALATSNILAVIGCSQGYWDPSITCSSKDYICYDSWPANTMEEANRLGYVLVFICSSKRWSILGLGE